MIKSLRVVIAFAGVLSAGVWTTAAPPVRAADKPNIVVFMLDDTNPVDGRLWNNPDLTPTLYDQFVARGINFTNAIDDTSLCCPSRATFLTGLHSFNHGVTRNDATLFQPSESLAVELTKAGYATMLVGKYMNHPEKLTGDLWTQHSAPWSVFDIFTSGNNPNDGYFTNYTMTTKDGQVLTPTEHSTQLITERTIAHMQATSPNTPIFAELAVADTHKPNIPMPGFESDPRWSACESMPPWNPPNYNEADVSDKPPFVRSTPLLPYANGWPMATMCREMLGVDWMVKQVIDELRAEGRLDNTLLVFTADNGMAWGQHRQQLKQLPYSTAIPVYMSWPDRWGTQPRKIDEYVSNIDFAPTLCAAAGCTLGPFPTGQSKPDGVNLLPLLDGNVRDLGRDALVESEWAKRPWAAVRTTDESTLGLWHYVEWQSGFRELYNVAPDQDPWEMNNLAYQPEYDSLINQLHTRLLELLAEGRPDTPGTIKIVQDSEPNNGQDFAFSGSFGKFSLDDDANATLPRTRSVTGLTAGDYTISQAVVAGWRLTSIACGPSSVVDLAAGRVIIRLQSGQDLVCTFRDTQPRPDGAIAISSVGKYKGNNTYDVAPANRQTQTTTGAQPGVSYAYSVTVKNRSLDTDSFTLSATTSDTNAFSVTVRDKAGADVTAAVMAGTYKTKGLAHDKGMTLTVTVTVSALALPGASDSFVLTSRSNASSTIVDTVRAITSV